MVAGSPLNFIPNISRLMNSILISSKGKNGLTKIFPDGLFKSVDYNPSGGWSAVCPVSRNLCCHAAGGDW